MTDLAGKVVLVTGAGEGAGRTLARAFAGQKANLAINDLTPINLDPLEAQIRAEEGQVRSYIVDVAKKMPIQGLINKVLDDWGRIDILVSCASVKPRASLLEMDDWDWQRSLDVNLTGVFLLMQAVARVMRIQQGGIMLTIGASPRATESQPSYLVCKAALVELSNRARQEFSAYGIQVHLITPDDDNDLVKQAMKVCSITQP